MTNSKKKTVTDSKTDSGKKARKNTTASSKTTIKKTSSKNKRKTINNLNISLEELLGAGCHFGHSVSKVNPRMQEYIFSVRDGVHIFDLIKTKNQLEKAISYLYKIISEGGKIIFVGTKRQAVESVEKAAQKTDMFYVNTRWIGGLLTNWPEIRKNLDRLEELNKKLLQKDTSLTKYEIGVLTREQRRLKDLYGGLMGLDGLPKALFVIDPKKEQTAVREAKRMAIEVIGIVDTNSDPEKIDYVIPANDDAKASIEYILNKVIEGIKQA
ncbi:MAG: 30S ribosomal protein S2 [Candidatus Shapirobacteria bacterium]|nr:30S ribosomal protein S2 [Candidatus Shapirobacteria bacterium]